MTQINSFLAGLTEKEAEAKLREFGLNELAKSPGLSGLKIFLSQAKSPLIYVLIFSGGITALMREWADSLAIFLAVILNASLGFWQERKAQRAMEALRQLLSPQAKVIRGGEQKTIEAKFLVPGDVIFLTFGSNVPADGIIIEANDLAINEATLTGESFPVDKKAAGILLAFDDAAHLNYKGTGPISSSLRAERAVPTESLGFAGTVVAAGIGKMLITATGMNTRLGKLGGQIKVGDEEKTPLQIQLAGLSKFIAIIVGAAAGLLFFLGLLFGYSPLEAFTVSVATAVAAIPEGLVVAVTVILALGAQAILRRKALVRKLVAAETLGSVSVICADKTGTLTEGKMRVVDSLVKIEGKDPRLEKILWQTAILCNDLRDPLETAMMEWAQRQFKIKNSCLPAGRAKFKVADWGRLDETPFSHKTKYIATLHCQPGKTKRLLLVSGAPEIVAQKTSLGKRQMEIWLSKFDELANNANRLVGFAYKEIDTPGGKINKAMIANLKWLGILLYEDPVRPEVKHVFSECRQAGIRVKVITGDYPATAMAVMGRLGVNLAPNEIITGDELESMPDNRLCQRLEETVLFARTSPEQKLKIVKVLQKAGETVAMTGDGVNDALAIKQADIGIVPGEASDVSKSIADMILLDSNLGTIIRAVEEGRNIFENIRKVVLYLLKDSFSEVILIAGSLFLGLPIPLTAAQILWINLVEDSLPAVALAFEPNDHDLMFRPPRKKNAEILDRKMRATLAIMLVTDLFLLGFYFWLSRHISSLTLLRTIVFLALGADSFIFAFSCRSIRKSIGQYNPFSNRYLNLSVILGLFLLCLAVYLPPLRLLLRTETVGLIEWLFVAGVAVFKLGAIELVKRIFI